LGVEGLAAQGTQGPLAVVALGISTPDRRTLPPVRTVLNPLGFLLAGLAIGYVLARPLNRLTWRDGENQIAIDIPPGSEAERQWRLHVSGLEGTARTAL